MIASFSVAAVAGIIVLFGDVESEPALRVLSSTAVIGLLSVAVLCGVVLMGRAGQSFGIVTVGVAVLSLGWFLLLIWGDIDWSAPVFEVSMTASILTASLSVASLLITRAEHRLRYIRFGLGVTLALMGIGVVLLLVLIWNGWTDDLTVVVRAAGIVWILAALGAVVVPVLSLVVPSTRSAMQRAGADEAATDAEQRLSSEAVRHIEAAARQAGLSPDELIFRVLPAEHPDR
ncbi:MAG: hypothetical protein ACTJHU_03470 [Mycetocola sp.]